jgi:hypothetical protein
MEVRLFVLVLVFIANFRVCQCKRYDRFALYSVLPMDGDHLKFLQNLEKQKYIDVIFWRKPLKLYHEIQFIVNPIDKDLFEERAQHFKMKADLLVPDIQLYVNFCILLYFIPEISFLRGLDFTIFSYR